MKSRTTFASGLRSASRWNVFSFSMNKWYENSNSHPSAFHSAIDGTIVSGRKRSPRTTVTRVRQNLVQPYKQFLAPHQPLIAPY